MKLAKRAKPLVAFLRANYLLTLFVGVVGLVGLFLVFKSLFSEPHEVYAKVKVSQGLWWASTAKPSQWYIDALKKGEVETDSGEVVAEILNVRYYPSYVPDQFDVYLTMKLTTTYNKDNGKYIFKRSPLTVASPVDFEFPSVAVSGTVIAMDDSSFEETFVNKTVVLSKNYAHPAEFSEITIADTYFDGEDTMLEIIKKEAVDSVYSIRDIGTNFGGRTENRKDITLTVQMMLQESGGMLFFGEEQIVRPGKEFYGATNNFTFSDYIIRNIE